MPNTVKAIEWVKRRVLFTHPFLFSRKTGNTDTNDRHHGADVIGSFPDMNRISYRFMNEPGLNKGCEIR